MTTILYILIGTCVMIAAVSLAGILGRRIAVNIRVRRQKRFTDSYMRVIYYMLFEHQAAKTGFEKIKNCRTHRSLSTLLAGLLAQLSVLTYGHEQERMRLLLRWQKLEPFLLRRIARSRGMRRAKYMKILAELPLQPSTAETAKRYMDDRNSYVRLYALLARINHNPLQIIEIMEDCKQPLSNFERSEIVLALRRKFAPAELYELMLESRNKNIILLGMNIVRIFSIENAREQLTHLVASHDKQIRNAALLTLARVKAPVSARRVIAAVSGISVAGRKRIYRNLVAEGYSQHAMNTLHEMEGDGYLAGYITLATGRHKLSLYPDNQLMRSKTLSI